MSDPDAYGLAPHDISTEQAVLGAMLLSSDAIAHCLDALTPRAFYRPAHQIILAAITAVSSAGDAVDAITVRAELEKRGDISKTGGPVYLVTLMQACPVAANAALYTRQLLDLQTRRDAAELASRVAQIAAAEGMTPEERLAAIYEAADGMAGVMPGQDRPPAAMAGEVFWQAMERLETGKPPGTVQFPFEDLRALIPYLRPGQLISIGARPSLGKSALGHDIARHVSLTQQLPVALFTMEMDRDEVMDRLIAAEAGVLHKHITDGTVDATEWDRMSRAGEKFTDCKLLIDDTPRISLAGIRARLRDMARTEQAHLAVIDYLQLMEGGGGENRQREVSALVSGLKGIAREFRIPVIMLFQLNRGPESRADKRPYLSDARESGAVENDSDIAILIHREDAYDRESPRAGEADLIVAKNRNGPRTTITVAFQDWYTRFVDMAPLFRSEQAEPAAETDVAPPWTGRELEAS